MQTWNVCVGQPTEGSNPFLSAILLFNNTQNNPETPLITSPKRILYPKRSYTIHGNPSFFYGIFCGKIFNIKMKQNEKLLLVAIALRQRMPKDILSLIFKKIKATILNMLVQDLRLMSSLYSMELVRCVQVESSSRAIKRSASKVLF